MENPPRVTGWLLFLAVVIVIIHQSAHVYVSYLICEETFVICKRISFCHLWIHGYLHHEKNTQNSFFASNKNDTMRVRVNQNIKVVGRRAEQ